MEKQRPDINPMPHFEMLPPRLNPLEIAVRGLHQIASFVLERHSVPKPTVDDMLMGDEDGTRA